MDALVPSALCVVGGWLLIALLFVLRDEVSGAQKEAGQELWNRVRLPHCRCPELCDILIWAVA